MKSNAEKFRTTLARKILVLTLCAIWLGCGENFSADASPTDASKNEALSSGKRVCKGAFFDANPVTKIFTDSMGTKLPMPYAVCDTVMTVIKGTADYNEVLARVAPYQLSPVKLAQGKTSVSFFLIEFKKGDVGRYNEFVVAYDVVGQGVPNNEMPWVNAFSSVVPAFLPTTKTFMERLILQSGAGEQAARDGVETVGTDKRLGSVAIRHAGKRTSFDVLDERGQRVVRGTFAEKDSLAEQLPQLNNLALAFGLPSAASLPPTPDKVVLTLLNVDIRNPTHMPEWSAIMNKPSPRMAEFQSGDSVEFGTQSELAKMLKNVKFIPQVSIRYVDQDIVYPPIN